MKKKTIILTAIAAATVGAAFGMLYTPARGEVTRRKLAAHLDLVKAKVLESKENLRDAFTI